MATAWKKFIPWMLLLAGTVAYSNGLGGVFIYDDVITLGRANHWRSASRPIQALFAESTRPVADLTFVANDWIDPGKTVGYHAVNIAIHLLACLVLYGLIRRTLRLPCFGDRFSDTAEGIAGLAAALWVCHPLTTGAVTYISQRYEILAAAFYLATLYAALRAWEPGWQGRGWGVAAVLCCWLGMGSKQVMITAPIAVLACDWVWFSNGRPLELLRRRWGLYLGLASSYGVFLIAGSTAEEDPASYHGGYAWAGVTPWGYALTQSEAILRYLRLSVWPTGLCFDYWWPMAAGVREVLIPFAGVAAVGIVGLTGFVRRKAWSVPVVLFFLILSPTSSLVPRPDAIVEYRAYLALACAIILLTVVVAGGCGWVCRVEGGRPWVRGVPLFGAGLIVLLVLILATRARNTDYGSEERLWSSVLRIRPGNPRAMMGLGAAYLASGRAAEAETEFRRVVQTCGDVTVASPGPVRTLCGQALMNLGVMRFREGRFAEAEALFLKAVTVLPEAGDIRQNLNLARARLHPSAGSPQDLPDLRDDRGP